ncbi:MAG TPA: hypothetical protein VFM48_07485 [Aquabacterium sp.]|nr:hypothetical protein [Aquabacterium sp.]
MPAQFKPGLPPKAALLSITAWNLMGGCIDWAALPLIAEMLGINDPEALVLDLVTIRDHGREE